jgi:acetyltransferase-like isoleucine patch superfamily enzyme
MRSFAKSALTTALVTLGSATRVLRVLSHARSHACFAPRVHPKCDTSVATQKHFTLRGSGETRGGGPPLICDNAVISPGIHIVSRHRITWCTGVYTSIRDAYRLRHEGDSVRKSTHRGAAIRVGCNAWIGRGVKILPRIPIGHQAVISTNAVVFRDVHAGFLVAGTSAQPLRQSAAL